MYRIVAKCDPYNARMHYHGEPVLKRDGATPVAWLFNNHEHLTLKEANQVILDLASMTAERKFANWGIAVRCLGKHVQGADCGTNPDGTRVLHDDSMTYAVEEEEEAMKLSELVILIRAVDPDCTYVDDAGQHVTTEWLVGTFAGRGFVAPTIEGALAEMCEYLNQHIGHNSIVGDAVTKSGWPDLKKVKEYLKAKK